jgi:hypothetical protein
MNREYKDISKIAYHQLKIVKIRGSGEAGKRGLEQWDPGTMEHNLDFGIP